MKTPDFDTHHLAELARINLTEAEHERFSRELEHILGYVDQLKTIDTTDVPETAQVTGLVNVLRADTLLEISEADLLARRDELLAAVPDKEQDMVKIPAIFSHE